MEVDDQFASELRGAIKSDEAALRLSHVSFIYKYINTHSNTNNLHSNHLHLNIFIDAGMIK